MSDHRRRSDRIRNLQQEGNNAPGPTGNNSHSRHGSMDSLGSGPSMGSRRGSNAGGRHAPNSPQIRAPAPADAPPSYQAGNEYANRGQPSRRPSMDPNVARPPMQPSSGSVGPSPGPSGSSQNNDQGYQGLGRGHARQPSGAGRGQPGNNASIGMQQQGPPRPAFNGGGQVGPVRTPPYQQGLIRHPSVRDNAYVVSDEDDSDDLMFLSQRSYVSPRPVQSKLSDPVPFPYIGGSRRSSTSRWEQAEQTLQKNTARNNHDTAVHNITMQIIRNINQEFFIFGGQDELRNQLYNSIRNHVLNAIKNGWISPGVLSRWGPGGGLDNGGRGPRRGGGGGSAGGASGGSSMVTA